VLSDENDNLAEYWDEKSGDALLVNADQLAASLRILKKNNLVVSTMAPAITCSAGQTASIEVDGFRITATPHITADEGVFLTTQTSLGYSNDVDANAVLRSGDTLLVRARCREADSATDESSGAGRRAAVAKCSAVYVAIIAELQR
jgi:hypothetical protein